MPELPEVETIVRGLQYLVGERILKAEKFRSKIRNVIPNDICSLIADLKILSITRRAKYIIFTLENNLSLIFHLGMSGKLTISDAQNYNLYKHDHFVLHMGNAKILSFNDPRRFGIVDLLNTDKIELSSYFSKLGVEPLSKKLDVLYLVEKFKNKKQPVKTAIMDSNIIVGVGNIYASESLYLAKISPILACCDLSNQELQILIDAIQETLKNAIIAGGSTLKDYKNIDNNSGYFQHQFKVYGKKGENCNKCGNIIAKVIQLGRSTFFCPCCQNCYNNISI